MKSTLALLFAAALAAPALAAGGAASAPGFAASVAVGAASFAWFVLQVETARATDPDKEVSRGTAWT